MESLTLLSASYYRAEPTAITLLFNRVLRDEEIHRLQILVDENMEQIEKGTTDNG